jgi:hypothetical protein
MPPSPPSLSLVSPFGKGRGAEGKETRKKKTLSAGSDAQDEETSGRAFLKDTLLLLFSLSAAAGKAFIFVKFNKSELLGVFALSRHSFDLFYYNRVRVLRDGVSRSKITPGVYRRWIIKIAFLRARGGSGALGSYAFVTAVRLKKWPFMRASIWKGLLLGKLKYLA